MCSTLWWCGTRIVSATNHRRWYHRGRKSVREYVTPLCMVSIPEGFIVPAAFGSNVGWLANLRATPDSKVVYEGSTYETTAEVIDLNQAIDYAGGTPGCDCWTQYKVSQLVLLRPVTSQTARTAQTLDRPVTTGQVLAGRN